MRLRLQNDSCSSLMMPFPACRHTYPEVVQNQDYLALSALETLIWELSLVGSEIAFPGCASVLH